MSENQKCTIDDGNRLEENMKSIEEIKEIKNRMQEQLGCGGTDSKMTRIVVGLATCGIASGAKPVLQAMADEIEKCHKEDVYLTQTGCIGLCQYEPIVEVFEPGRPKVTYIWMNPEKAKEVVNQHLIHGNIVEEYTLNAADQLL